MRLGRLEQVRTRAAPTPTNISTKSEPLMWKNGTPASPAIAPGEACFADSRGASSTIPWESSLQGRVALGVLQEVDDLPELLFGLVMPATSSKVTFGPASPTRLARLRPKLSA